MNGAGIGGLMVVLTLLAIVLAICWTILPFAIMGTKPLLRQILAEQRDLRPLGLGGVKPTLENLSKGTYPHATVLRLVVRRAGAGTELRRFLKFLESPASQDVMRRYGYLPSVSAWEPNL